ncbi:phage holin, lambda family [bacterium]|nr:phage holin, lambda family [bacterium]
MPDNPNTWADILGKFPPEMLEGGFMAIVIAVLRVIYDKEETKPIRIILEAAICGLLALTFYFGIIALKLDPSWSVFCGGVIGYLGSAAVRGIAMRLIQKKIED